MAFATAADIRRELGAPQAALDAEKIVGESLHGNDWFAGIGIVRLNERGERDPDAPWAIVVFFDPKREAEVIAPASFAGWRVFIEPRGEVHPLGAPTFSQMPSVPSYSPKDALKDAAKDQLDSANPVPGCSPPDRLTPGAFQGYAQCAGVSQAKKWAADEGLDPDLAEKFLSGDATWRDFARPALAGYGFHGDPTQVVRDDGSIDWREVAGQAGSFAAYSACASQPETAPVASLCGQAGYYGGKYLYDNASKAWEGFHDFVFGSGPEYPPLPNTIPTTKQDALRLIGSVYLDKGQSDYLFNLSMLRGVALQFFAIARGLDALGVDGMEAMRRVGYAGPLGWRSLLSTSRPFSEPMTPGSGLGGESLWRIWEHELVEALADGVAPSPLGPEDPDKLSPYFDLWTIEHTDQFVGVRCGGVLDPTGKLGIPQAPLFQFIGPGHQYGSEAASYGCTGKYANTWVEVHVDPQVRHFCEQDRANTLVLKDAMLMALQTASERATLEAIRMRRAKLAMMPVLASMLPGGSGATKAFSNLRSSRSVLDAIANGETEDPGCSSYGDYLADHKRDIAVVGALTVLGAIAASFLPTKAPEAAKKARLTTRTRAAAAGGGVGLLLGAGIAAATHADWKKRACP